MSENTYPKVRFNALGLDQQGITVKVVYQKGGWNPLQGNVLTREGNCFVGEVRANPGEKFCIAVFGLDDRTAREVFERRRQAGLTAEGEQSEIEGDKPILRLSVIGDPQFPVSGDYGKQYPCNVAEVA